jgi:SpoVK/Ycf46/Vps4 family AAA+-type ATPase
MAHPVWAKRTPPVSITQFASMLSMDESLTPIECVAEGVKKPLISLTSSDLGTEPDAVEQRLLRWFDLANVWNAVLLIDEADVFLERRSHSDLRRNNLVVIFLRTLEYYRGILFLTTNRVGMFDEAFLSRIDVAIYFPALRYESRLRLWSIFIQKLEMERRSEIRVEADVKYYIENDEDLLRLHLNGREIRSGAS